jgi:hypothetical protein
MRFLNSNLDGQKRVGKYNKRLISLTLICNILIDFRIVFSHIRILENISGQQFKKQNILPTVKAKIIFKFEKSENQGFS